MDWQRTVPLPKSGKQSTRAPYGRWLLGVDRGGFLDSLLTSQNKFRPCEVPGVEDSRFYGHQIPPFTNWRDGLVLISRTSAWPSGRQRFENWRNGSCGRGG